MVTVCSACGYERKSTDQAPDWQCPACGKAYAKTTHESHELSLGYVSGFATESRSPQREGSAYQGGQVGLISGIAIFGSLLVMVLVVFVDWRTPNKGHWATIVLAMPWIAMAAICARRDSFLLEVSEDASGILWFSLLPLVCAVGWIALGTSRVFDLETAWHKGIVFAIPFGLACAAVVRGLNRKVAQRCLWLTGSLIIMMAYAYGGSVAVLGNRWFDHGSPTVYQATVIGKHVRGGSRGGADTYLVTLEPWGPVRHGDDMPVERRDYDAMVLGRSVICVSTHPGAFGMPWGRPVPCTGNEK